MTQSRGNSGEAWRLRNIPGAVPHCTTGKRRPGKQQKRKRMKQILRKRGETARREAEKVKEWGTRLDYDTAAAR